MEWINEEWINFGLMVSIVVVPFSLIGIGIAYFCRWWVAADKAVSDFKRQVSEIAKGSDETR